MKLQYSSIQIIPDNDTQYFLLLESIINSVDDECKGMVYKTPSSYIIKLSSALIYIDVLIKAINELNTFVKIPLIWSKSSKIIGNIQFSIII